jgi:branched-chain amino acid transport system permease protein
MARCSPCRNAVDIATLAMIYVMLGLGPERGGGLAGLLDLGFVGFYAVGAYTYALLFHWAGWSFWEALPLAGAAAALFGFVLGFPVLRLRGDYLAIVTLGFGEIIRLCWSTGPSFTGGPDGISSIPALLVRPGNGAQPQRGGRHHLPPVLRAGVQRRCTW